MQLLYRSIDSLTIGGVTFILRVTTDGVNTVVDFEQNPRSVTAESRYDVKVYYGNLQRTVSIGSRNSGTVTFPYAADASRIILSGAAVVYGGNSMGNTASFSWGAVYGRPDPTADFLPEGPECVSNSAVRCTVYAPEGKFPVLLGVWAYRKHYSWGFQM